MYYMNQYGEAEQLDFEDEKGESNSPTFMKSFSPYGNQVLLAQEMNEILRKEGVDNNETTLLFSDDYLKADGNKEVDEKKCNVDEINVENRKECNTNEIVDAKKKDCTADGIEDGEKRKCATDEIEEGEATDDDNVDIEDGEIEGKSKSNYTQKHMCRFYQRGRCTWGNECHYLHLSDKGKYSMFDTPSIPKLVYSQSGFMNKCNFLRPISQEPPNELESIWDRALVEAKERIKQSKMKKECFEDKLYMTVQNDGRFVDKGEYSRQRYILPASIPKRQIHDFPSQYGYNDHPKLNVNVNEEPKLVRKTYGSKTDYDLNWRDPWRRSKTPPHRKKCSSKRFSKSSRSPDNSESSWSSRSCQSPSPILSGIKTHSKRSVSLLYKDLHKQSSSKSSCSESISYSHSSSSEHVHSHGKKHKMSSRKRKASFSSESIILPYTRRSRSKSRSSTLFQQHKTGVREYHRRYTKNSHKSRSKSPIVNSKVKHVARDSGVSKVVNTYRSISPCFISKVAPEDNFSKVSCSQGSKSRSLSNSSKFSTNLKSSDADSFTSESCSDMSISPVSDSPLKRKCRFSDKGFRLDRGSRDLKFLDNTRHSLQLGETNLSCSRTTNENRCSGKSNACITSEVKTQQKACKQMSALEMELWKYGGGFKPILKNCPMTSKLQSSSVDPKLSRFKKPMIEKSIVPVTSLDKSKDSVRSKLSKRDLLIEQLKAVEEAIAKKKKLHA